MGFSLDEVSKHTSESDCWIVVDGKVYDVTKFLPDHPGGDEVIIASTGKDATDDFENVGHSKSARAMLEQYLIGSADVSTFPDRAFNNATKKSSSEAAGTGSNTSDLIVKLVQYVIPLLILLVALGFRFFGM